MLGRRIVLAAGLGGVGLACGLRGWGADPKAAETFAVSYTEDEWRHRLTPDQYAVLREEGTERPFTSPLLHEERVGKFACVGCNQDLFASSTKFDSHTGWPSFWAPLDKAVETTTDRSFGVERTEVHCSNCGGHLGHVFNDGPKPTGLRYCMDGVALTFKSTAA